MSSEAVPPPSGTPATLGPYSVVGRWHSAAGGQVLAAHGPQGDQVELVLMAPGPAQDAAARDRFAAAAERMSTEHPGRLLALQTDGPLAWAALRPGSGPEAARPLLEAPLPADAGVSPGAGPAFAPHWSNGPQTYPPMTPLAPVGSPLQDDRPWWRRWWLVIVMVLLVLVLLLILSACWPRLAPSVGPSPSPSGSSSPGPTPSGTTPTPSGSPTPDRSGTSGSPTPSNQAQGTPTQSVQAGPGVAGPSFTEDDRTVEMRLAGLPFPFRVPEGWECERDPGAAAPVVRYVCTDMAFDDSAGLPAPSGIVQAEPCPHPCGDLEWETVRNRASDDGGWVPVDETTLTVLDFSPEVPLYERIRMSRLWSPIGGEIPDSHVYTRFAAPPELFGEVQKITNDIRANTP